MVKEAPEKAKALAIARIQANPIYTTQEGVEWETSFVLEQIAANTTIGREAIRREWYILDAYRDLLRNKGYL